MNKSSPTMFSVEQEIAYMIKYKEKFIKTMGKPTYDRLLKKLQYYLLKK